VDLSVGALVRGKYRVERVLGEGGMGVVVAAWDPDLERRVAIKVLRSVVVAHVETVQRFLREARAAAKLQSDHVAHVIEVGSLEDGAPFMVMEYLEGHDLSVVVERVERPPYGVVASWVIDACQALREAHGLGIVHRDLKPANLFLASRRDGPPLVKVLDFGISKVAGPQDLAPAGVTRPSVALGTPEYMAPEQMVSTRDVDARADIFALGVILYELCTGVLPFTGETTTQRYLNISMKPPLAPRSIQPSIPPGLEAVILACLAAERDQRLGNVSELIERLRPFAATGADAAMAPTRVVGAGPVAAVSQRVSGALAVATDRAVPPRAGARWPVAVVAVGLMGAAAIAVVVARHGGAPRADPAVAVGDAATPAPATAPSAPMVVTPTAEPTPIPPPSVSASATVAATSASASAPQPSAGPRAPAKRPASTSTRKVKDSYD
jgi:serine/threonine-protein kinase